MNVTTYGPDDPIDPQTGLEVFPGIVEVPDVGDIFSAGDDNINVGGEIHGGNVGVWQTALCDGVIDAGEVAVIAAGAVLQCEAKGDGSIAELDFSGSNNGIGCPILRVDMNP